MRPPHSRRPVVLRRSSVNSRDTSTGIPEHARSSSGETAAMRLHDEHGSSLPRVHLFFTHAEAGELRDALETMLSAGPTIGWHEHVMSDDGQTEISVSWDLIS